MTWTWRTTPEGLVEVERGSGFEVIELGGEDRFTRRIEEEWLDLAERHAKRTGVPLSWILGVIYSESGGDPRASNFCCGGLMALARVVYHLTESEALDPETNVRLGSDTLRALADKGYDLPAVASMYNAGPSQKTGGPKTNISSVWGYAEDMPAVPWTGYIEKVVRASNWWHPRLPALLGAEALPPASVPVLVHASAADSSAAGSAFVLAMGLVGGYLLVKHLIGR